MIRDRQENQKWMTMVTDNRGGNTISEDDGELLGVKIDVRILFFPRRDSAEFEWWQQQAQGR